MRLYSLFGKEYIPKRRTTWAYSEHRPTVTSIIYPDDMTPRISVSSSKYLSDVTPRKSMSSPQQSRLLSDVVPRKSISSQQSGLLSDVAPRKSISSQQSGLLSDVAPRKIISSQQSGLLSDVAPRKSMSSPQQSGLLSDVAPRKSISSPQQSELSSDVTAIKPRHSVTFSDNSLACGDTDNISSQKEDLRTSENSVSSPIHLITDGSKDKSSHEKSNKQRKVSSVPEENQDEAEGSNILLNQEASGAELLCDRETGEHSENGINLGFSMSSEDLSDETKLSEPDKNGGKETGDV